MFPKNLKLKVNKIIKLSKIFNETINIVIHDERKKVSIEQKIKLKTIDIFQEIDNHGFITNTSWFLGWQSCMAVGRGKSNFLRK